MGGLSLVLALLVFTAQAPPAQAASSISCVAPAGPSQTTTVTGGFHGFTPLRIADTRPSSPVPAGCWLRVDLPSAVPFGAEAVVLSVTAAEAPATGFLTGHSCDSARPGTSNVNVHVGDPTSNLTIVPVGLSRQVCVYSDQVSDVIVDVYGWMGPGGAPFQQMSAVRALDTRSPATRPATVDGIIEPGERVALDRARLGVPPNASGVMVNITATQATGDGFIAAFPCAGGFPPTSNVNYSQGTDRANSAIVDLDAGGQLCVEVGAASTHVIVDVVAWLGGTSGLRFDSAENRIADSRNGVGGWSGRFGAGETRPLQAVAQMPLGTEVALLGVVATNATANGFVQFAPCGGSTATSSLNYVAGADITNLVAVPLDPDGSLCVTASSPTDLVIDLFGGFGSGALVRSFDVGPFTTFPAFDPEQTDYIAYCGSNLGNAFSVNVAGTPGAVVEIVGSSIGTGTISASKVLVPGDAIVVKVTSPAAAPAEYWVRCVPPDFPVMSTKRVAETQPGWYLVATASNSNPPGDFAIILDSNGVPVWYRRAPQRYPLQNVLDFKRWPDGTLAWVVANQTPWGFDPTLAYERFTLDGTVVATHKTVGYDLDHHDMVPMPNGNILVPAYPARTAAVDYDCVSANGAPLTTKTVLDLVIQEITPSGALVKEWDADVLGLSGTPKIDIGTGGSDYGEVRLPRCFDQFHPTPQYDAVHLNGLQVSADGSQVIFSARHQDAIYAIDWATGDIAWKLGGTTTPESLTIVNDPLGGPARQHDVHILPNGHVTAFDNRANVPGVIVPATGASRYVEYIVDNTAKTATMVLAVPQPDGLVAGFMGSGRIVGDDNVLIGWGSLPGPAFGEYRPNGDTVFEVTMNGFISYRAVKEPLAAFDLATLRATAGP